MKVLITGGHFSPALQIIKDLGHTAEIIVVGRKYTFEGDNTESLEYMICKDKGINFSSIITGRLQRKFTKYTIPAILKFPIGIIHSVLIIIRTKPDVILTFGSYVGLTVSLAAYLLGVPVVVHEQTQNAGLANRIISGFAKKICISFRSSEKYFPESKTVLTGNPVREEIFTVRNTIKVPKGYKTIYITGGSSGSHFINQAVSKVITRLLENYNVIHQTGDSKVFNDYEKLITIRENLGPKLKERYILKKFIFPDEIGWVFKNSSLIVSRSGINTVTEILALSKPCLLIPLAHGQVNEQLENARFVKDMGNGDYIEMKDFTSEILYEKIIYILKNGSLFTGQADKVKKHVFTDTSQRIINVLKLVYEEKKQNIS